MAVIDRDDGGAGRSHWLDGDDVNALHRLIADYYPERLAALLEGYPRDQKTIRIEWGDLAMALPDVADDYFVDPNRGAYELDDAFREYDTPTGDSLDDAHVRVGGLNQAEHRRVSDIRAEDTGAFIAIRADLARVTAPDWRYQTTVFECADCETTNTDSLIRQPRGRSVDPPSVGCPACESCQTWAIDGDTSRKVDYRIARLQDPPGVDGTGQPTVNAYVEGGDLLTPAGEKGIADHSGESVVVYGQYIADPDTALMGKGDASPSRHFVVEAIDFEESSFTPGEMDKHRDAFGELAARDDAHDLVRQSIAPQLHADAALTGALDGAWMYLFGAPRIETGTETARGDIHMLMVGDPSTGKSTILRGIARLSPRSRLVSGGSATGVGLTATVEHDDMLGWFLEPGVLPRANGGHAIVDELDKAAGDATDKLHDALEGDQRIDVAKASVHASLNTRCGLLGATNPEAGRFDRYQPVGQQIDLDPALLSRFDLIFTFADEVDEERDDAIVSQILAPPDATTPAVETDVLRAWIAYARQHVHPATLTDDAADAIRAFYHEVRQVNIDHGADGDDDAPIPVTARMAEAAKRCAAASARLRLDETITVADVERATGVLKRVIGDTTFDSDTGTFDAGRVDEAGAKVKASTQAERVDRLKMILQNAGTPLTMDEIMAEAGKYGITPEKTEHTVGKMYDRGEVSQPASGEYRWIDI